MKKSTWCLLGAVALIFMLWMLRSVREGYANPQTCPVNGTTGKTVQTGYLPSNLDVDNLVASLDSNSLSPVAWIDGYLSWLQTNFPEFSGGGKAASQLIFGYLYSYAVKLGASAGKNVGTDTGTGEAMNQISWSNTPYLQAPKISCTPTACTDSSDGKFLAQYASALQASDPTLGGAPNADATPANLLNLYTLSNDKAGGNGTNVADPYAIMAVYSYYYGTCAPPPPAPSPMSGSSASTPSSASLAPTAPGSGPTPTPVPSNSSTVSVPSPCHAGLQSIPGGSMEFKCFTS
jgi:hypothetical protein